MMPSYCALEHQEQENAVLINGKHVRPALNHETIISVGLFSECERERQHCFEAGTGVHASNESRKMHVFTYAKI